MRAHLKVGASEAVTKLEEALRAGPHETRVDTQRDCEVHVPRKKATRGHKKAAVCPPKGEAPGETRAADSSI